MTPDQLAVAIQNKPPAEKLAIAAGLVREIGRQPKRRAEGLLRLARRVIEAADGELAVLQLELYQR